MRHTLTGTPPEVVPARMVNEVLYCERLAYLEWAQKEFADNYFTVDGRENTHRRVDAGGQKMEAPNADTPWTARSLWLTSERLGLTAKIDLVESDGKSVEPVEYKRGRRPRLEEGAFLPERAQLCAQVMLLREAGYACSSAFIWFAGSRERVEIMIDDALIAQTSGAIARLRDLVAAAEIPPPLDRSPKCDGCSLAGLCLPDEVRALCEPEDARAPRRLQPTRDDRAPLYVQEPGAKIGVRRSRLMVRRRGTERKRACASPTHRRSV